MSTDLLEGFAQRLGDPERARKHQRRLDRDLGFLLSHMDEWRKTHPNRWVAVYGGELVAIEDSKERLLEAIGKKKLPLREVLVDFISEQQVALVL